MMANRLLDPLALPSFSTLTSEHIGPALDAALANYEKAVDAVIARGSSRFQDAWMPIERAENCIDALWSAVSQLKAVADTPQLRAAHAAGQARLVEVRTRVLQNRELYESLIAMSASAEFAGLPEADRVAVEHRLRAFRLRGVALEPEPRRRFTQISVELSRLSTEFASAVTDATDAWSEHVSDETLLAGVPEPMKEMLAAAARAKGMKEGWLVTLQAPSVNAVLSFAQDRRLRERVYAAFVTRASDQGPHAGRFDNGPRIRRILELRRDAASLLGFRDPIERSLETKMASSADEVLHFLRDLARRAKPRAERELAELRRFALEELDLEDVQPWDVAFASERLRLARYAFDDSEVRAYFPIEHVLAGWQWLLNQLFGIRLTSRTGVDVWHEDVRYYDLTDENGAVFAGLYLDLFAREGKREGAWMAPARPRLRGDEGFGFPAAYLTCNFAPANGKVPSLLSHRDMQTLLHETGHSLHHLLTQVDRPGIAGIAGFEWDAVELPSQLLEDFAWDPRVLTRMSCHYRTGDNLPTALFERMVAARHFQSGLLILRHIELGLFDWLLHLDADDTDPMQVLEAVREEVAVLRPPAWHRFPHAFTHIFSGSYAAGYYSYLWAEVLAADAFQKFAEQGLIDRATGDLLREEVLSRGATRPAAASFRAFRGRNPDPHAMLIRRGLIG